MTPWTKRRSNRIDTTIVRVEGTKLIVAELDAVEGTPVLVRCSG